MPAPYHVRLAVSQYGDQFRAELFTEDLGDTEGDTLAELPPSVGEWVPFLAQGADLPPDAARQLGKDLFAALLGQVENAKKWTEVLDRAAKAGQPVRLLIDATTDAVRDLPYGLLCEPHDDWFLFRAGKGAAVRFVRILRRCSPRPLRLNPRPSVIVVAAEPTSPDVPAFDAPLRLKALCAALKDVADVNLCGPNGVKPLADLDPADPAAFAPFTKATRDACKSAVAGPFDVIHLLAHGHGAGVLLCAPGGAPAETTAGELAEWCGAGGAGLAFLQVCKAGQTGGRGGFGGVAQQLLSPHGGNLAAVVASTFPLDAEHSTAAAAAFYRQLAAGKSPEEALTADRPETDWCWAFLELWVRPGALGGTRQRAAFQFVSPYRGLSSYTERDADLFFGRRSETSELLQILRAEPAVCVVGDSGSGKTSLLQAGLVYAVRQGGFGGNEAWRIVYFRPGYAPGQALLAALRPGDATTPTPDALAAALRADARPLLLLIDQFEEVFTLARDPGEGRALTQALAAVAAERPDRFRVVIGIRSEFLGQAAGLPGLSRLLRRPWVLRPPGADNLRDIVAGPAGHCGYAFEGPLPDGNPFHSAGLLDRILADPLLATRDGAAPSLPLLQFALERLWLKAVETGQTVFTHAAYDALGGLGSAIAQHAEAVYQATPAATGLGAGARGEAEHLFTALVSSRGTRQPRPRADLEAEARDPAKARGVIDYLVGERLLTARTDPANPAVPLVDLAHEAVIRHWDRLRGWLAEDPQGRAMREAFRQSAERWEGGWAGVPPKSTRGLPGADVGRNYLTWIDAHRPALSPLAAEFVAAIRAYLARRKRDQQAVFGGMAALAVTACAFAAFAYVQTGKAERSAADAGENLAKAQKNEKLAEDRERDAQAATRTAELETAKLALDRGVQTSEQGRPRLGLLSMAYSLRKCPPAATGKAAGDLRAAVLTNLAGWAPHMLRLADVRLFHGPTVATDPAGTVILCRYTEGGGEVLKLFDIDGPADAPKQLGRTVPAPAFTTDTVNLWADVNADRRTVLLSTGQGYVRLWDVLDGAPLGPEIVTGAFGAAVLAPDRSAAATGDATGKVTVWNPRTGEKVWQTAPHPGKVYALAFSPDGKHLAAGCGRAPEARGDPDIGVVHLFDAATGTAVRTIPLPVAATAVAFSPHGRRLAAGGFDMFVWDVDALTDPARRGEPPRELNRRSSPESTVAAAFDPADRDHLLVVNPSGGLAITHPREDHFGNGERLSPQGWLVGAGFRADGTVFTANVDGTVRLWARPTEYRTVPTFAPPRGGAVLSVDFHPKGTAVAAGTRDGFAYVFDRSDPAKFVEFACAPPGNLADRAQVADVAFSADGARLIAQDLLFRVFVFDIPAFGAPGPVLPHPRAIRLLAAAADGRTVLAEVPVLGAVPVPGAGATPTMCLVSDLDTGQHRGGFLIPGEYGPPSDEADDGFLLRVRAAGFSPDRTRVAVADRGGAVHVFRTDATGVRVAGPFRHEVDGCPDAIRSLEFDPSGDRLLTRSPRGRGLWRVADGARVNLLHNRVGIQLSRFGPGGRLVLGGTNFNSGEVWYPDGRDAVPLPLVHAGEVWGIAADAGETRVLTASYDRTARVWDVATGKPIAPPYTHAKGVSDADFSPDGKFALTGSWDGTMKLWRVPVPLPDDEPRVTAWVEARTGLRVTPSGIGEMLSAGEWAKRKADLARLGGPFPGVDER